MNILKKSLLGFLAFFISATSIFAAPAMAQSSPWYAPTLEDFNKKVTGAPENEIFGERYTQAQVYWIVLSLANIIAGQSVLECIQKEDATQIESCLVGALNSPFIPGTSSDSGSNNTQLGAILPLANLVDLTISSRPASGVKYVSSIASKLNIVDTANAQQSSGFGYTTLSPVIPLWSTVRNMAYALTVVVIVILAFMIMMRTKISPQASLTVQVALPRIVIALILITFSFAIAGFLIDISYLILGLIGALFGVTEISTLNAAEMFGGLQNWGNGMVSIGVMLFLYIFAATWVASVGLGIVSGGILGGMGGVAGVIFAVIILIIYLVALIKILWLMFRSLIVITMLIIFSPFYFLWGVVSTGQGFGGWLKTYIGNLSVYVTVPLFIFLANVIMWGAVPGDSVLAPSLFLNPYGIRTNLIAGGVQLPGFFGGYNAIFGMIGGLVLLLSAPKMASGIRDIIITGRGQLGADLGSYAGPALMYGSYKAGRNEVIAKGSGDASAENIWRSIRNTLDFTSKKIR